MYGYFFV
ncbi:Protein of unknown function [Bacillus wiedmannii]|nr:Protein of unknown function [Bacillus wiedmannii]